ncbi:MAG: hypothetical protein ACFNLW_11985, partial [Olsenella sp.]
LLVVHVLETFRRQLAGADVQPVEGCRLVLVLRNAPFSGDIHDLVMTLSWRYGEAYDYYKELRKDPRARLYAVWRMSDLASSLYHEGLIGARERERLYAAARRYGINTRGDWLPPDVPPYG